MAARRSKTVGVPAAESVSVSVRKIDNGWIASHSRSGPKGYESKETFHTKKPKIDLAAIGNTGGKITERTPVQRETKKPAQKGTAALRRAGGERSRK